MDNTAEEFCIYHCGLNRRIENINIFYSFELSYFIEKSLELEYLNAESKIILFSKSYFLSEQNLDRFYRFVVKNNTYKDQLNFKIIKVNYLMKYHNISIYFIPIYYPGERLYSFDRNKLLWGYALNLLDL